MTKTVVATLLLLAPLVGRAGADPGAVAEIRGYFDRAMYRTGRVRLDALLAKEPDSAPALALLSELRFLEEDWEEAEAAARRAVEIDGSDAGHWMLWARARFQQGREKARDGKPPETVAAWFAQAETGFRRVQEIEPSHPDVLWWIGWTREWQGRYGVARQFYETHIEQFPGNPGGYRRLAGLLASQAKRTEDPAEARRLRREALAAYDLGLERAGENAETLYDRALQLLSEDRKDEAIESLRRSVRADPGFARSWNQLATKVDEAEVLVPLAIEVLAKHPTSALAARWAGYHTVRREPREGEKPWTRYELTLDYVLPALEVHGDDEELMKLAFRAAQALIGDTPKTAPNAKRAVDAFARIHRAYAWSGDAANNLGFYFREVRKYHESLAWYLKSVEREPENQDLLNDTGLMFLFHFPADKEKGLPYFLKTVALVREGDQRPERGYWDALENLCKHYWEVDRQPEKVVEYARLRYVTTKGVEPYNMSQVAEGYAKKARRALGK